MLPLRSPSGSASSVPIQNGRFNTWNGVRTTPARCITDVFQSTTKFAELLVDAMSATELLTAYRIGARLCDKIVTELAGKAETLHMRTESDDKKDHRSDSEEWNNKIMKEYTLETDKSRGQPDGDSSNVEPVTNSIPVDETVDVRSETNMGHQYSSKVPIAEIPDKSEGLKIRCKPENATDSNQLQFPAAELQQDSRSATKEVTSKQPDKYGDKHNEETALDLRVSRSSSSTIRSCSPSEDDYVILPSGTNKHSRISRRHSKHGRQSQRVEPQARISSTEKKFHRRPGLRPARSRRHRVHTDVTNQSTSDNVSFIPSRRSRRNRMCVDDDNSHAGFDYTSQLNIRAPFGQNDSCIQTCSTCNIEFKDAVSFVKHIQQIHVGLELDADHTNSISSMDSDIANYRISEWRTQGLDPSVNVPLYCANQATGTQNWSTRYPIVNYGPGLTLSRNSEIDQSFGEQCFVK